MKNERRGKGGTKKGAQEGMGVGRRGGVLCCDVARTEAASAVIVHRQAQLAIFFLKRLTNSSCTQRTEGKTGVYNY